MKIRFGYVSHALALWDCSPAKTITFTRWKALSKQEREEKLYEVTKQNLLHAIRILHYNIAHEIPLYRLSSFIVPLATHPEVRFDYINTFKNLWTEMIESKKKDLALLRLVEELSSVKGVKRKKQFYNIILK